MYNTCSIAPPPTKRGIACVGASRIKNWNETFCYASPHKWRPMRSLVDARAYRCVDYVRALRKRHRGLSSQESGSSSSSSSSSSSLCSQRSASCLSPRPCSSPTAPPFSADGRQVPFLDSLASLSPPSPPSAPRVEREWKQASDVLPHLCTYVYTWE